MLVFSSYWFPSVSDRWAVSLVNVDMILICYYSYLALHLWSLNVLHLHATTLEHSKDGNHMQKQKVDTDPDIWGTN